MAVGATRLMSTHREEESTSKSNDQDHPSQAAAAAAAAPPPPVDEHEQDAVMPGFRFHPTEEELIEFYLRRKVEGRRFNIELIAFLDLYRHDPWELPALAAIGEKEWYFYVPRDKKYRNGDRPNRVTKSGYWKATGADRMIRSETFRSIGIKKTLVFYSGKAPKGIRTGWTMNEYRLPIHETERLQKAEISLCRVYKRAGIKDHPSLPRSTPRSKGSQPVKVQTPPPANQEAVSRSIQHDEETMLFLQFKHPSASSSPQHCSSIYANSPPNNVDDLHKLVNGAGYRHQDSSSISDSHENTPFPTPVTPISLISYIPSSQPQTTAMVAATNTPDSAQVVFPWDWSAIHEGSKDFTTFFK